MNEQTGDRTEHDRLSGAPDRWPLSAREAALALGVNERTVRRAIARGALPATKHAGVYRIVPGDLARYRSHPRRPRPRPFLPQEPIPGGQTPVEPAVAEAGRLPTPLSPIVGRARERAEVAALLLRPDVRLVTLTGPGGAGKTRLSVEVAATLEGRFAGGACFVPLASVGAPDLVLPAIARALGVRGGDAPDGDRPLAERLRCRLRDRQLLLVLDNIEHLAAASSLVADLLTACPWLKALATSRCALHLRGEHEFAVPPLRLPDLARRPTLAELARAEAVSLFLARARAVCPDFFLSRANAATVVEVCRQLDGLPLAIELAAARIKVLSPEALLARLGNRLQILTGGPRDLPARQRTMRDAIAWSYDLLSPDEQALFRRLAVFAGGWALEAAEAVSSLTPDPRLLTPTVLDGVAALVDQSLVRREVGANGEPRFGMLETVREFALERLAASDEEATIRDRHARWCTSLASRTLTFPLQGRIRPDRLDQLEAEVDNLHAALTWLERRGEAAALMELAVALTYFWSLRSRRLEGRRWLERALTIALDDEVPAALHASAWHAVAALARTQDDLTGAEDLAEEALARFRALGNLRNVAAVLQLLGTLARGQEEFDRATRFDEEALALFRDAQDPFWVALVSCDLGILAHWQGDSPRAIALLDEAIAGFRTLDDPWGIGTALSYLALVEGDRGEVERAVALHHESLTRWRQVGSREALLDGVARIACLAVAAGRAAAAARLLGAVDALGSAIGYVFERPEQARCARAVEAARAALGGEALAAALAAGRALPFEQAVAEATAVLGRLRVPEGTGVGLTPRELEVLRLLAAGRSDREIAGELFISHRTVHRHVANIYAKLGVDSRVAAARAARADGLLGDEPSSSS